MKDNRGRTLNWIRGWCPKVSVPSASQPSGVGANQKGERFYPYLAIFLLLWFITGVLNYLKQPVLAIVLLALATVFGFAFMPRVMRFAIRKTVRQAQEMAKKSDLSSPFGGRDFLSLFFSNKGWIKLAYSFGIRKTMLIYFLLGMALLPVLDYIAMSVLDYLNLSLSLFHQVWLLVGYPICFQVFYILFFFRRQISKALKEI